MNSIKEQIIIINLLHQFKRDKKTKVDSPKYMAYEKKLKDMSFVQLLDVVAVSL